MGKTRDLFKKIRDTKGTFHVKMVSKMGSKDRNGMDLTQAEDIRKRWQEYTEELYKKIFMTQIITLFPYTTLFRSGSIRDRNGMDLTEAEDIRKRWQEYTEELYKKDLHDRSEEHTSELQSLQ